MSATVAERAGTTYNEILDDFIVCEVSLLYVSCQQEFASSRQATGRLREEKKERGIVIVHSSLGEHRRLV